MADDKNPREATSFADTLHRQGEPDSSQWVEAESVTAPKPIGPANTTLADRAAQRQAASTKQVDADSGDVSNKAVSSARTKRARAGS